ncbi:DUF3173 domain-containing protein [Granulicatella sp. zg-ZJ]|uniref:DUF3173 family protein n=1 Tax=unclassified Granulicatella TaxID=2630493 RepID=UPI0013BFDB7A|nr:MULTISPECIES: DUF3173 family protein [unclassified Granulicatella]MBS4751160.1 DUF3173 family protein [Carnobacteriaceae bacterium zg-ZUI78]NEW63331.1 DUF3173 domain-containing protein [Granulicatella sp. zg-ZJ]NEW66930.1 DUF3173 domain-containing protein [Granulicatella sp. zg-84]QMI85891.1 DUF3173 family protein [Carnobacteriaceae bacterium zg-84]
MNYITITKDELIHLGYTPTTAKKIIRQGKQLLVEKGFSLYNNKRVGTIPIKVAETILGYEIKKEN